MAAEGEEVSTSHTDETYKSVISISQESFKAPLLLNGGAVVALLAYLGQSPDRTSPDQSRRLVL